MKRSQIIFRITIKFISLLNKFLGPLYKIFSEKTILVLGDSHVEVFYHPLFLRICQKVYFDVVSVPAATISGLDNPKSKTQAKNIFEKALKEKKYDYVLFCLGEVDTGFLIWYKTKKNNIPVNEILTKSIHRYCKLIFDVNIDHTTIVLSAPLPTIEDDRKWGKVADLRREVHTKQLERTILTVSFNNQVEAFCRIHNIDYINLDKESLGDNGLVRPELKNSNKYDHHYNKTMHAKMIFSHLSKLI